MKGVRPDGYTTQYKPKRSGGTRRIDIPSESILAEQRRILRRYLSLLQPSPFAHGFVKGRSPVTAAIPHVGKRVVMRIDIRDFFNSITFENWRKTLGWLFRFDADMHRSLCTAHSSSWGSYRGRCLDWFFDHVERYCFIQVEPDAPELAVDPPPTPPGVFPATIPVPTRAAPKAKTILPQGFATSPALANLYLRRFDWSIARMAFVRYNANYTRYADDLIFSGPAVEGREFKPLPAIISRVRRRLAVLDLEVNEKKIVVMRRPQQQKVLGLVVNDKPGPSRSYRKNLRAALYQVRRGRVMDDTLRGELAYIQGVEKQKSEPVMTYYHYEVLRRAAGEPSLVAVKRV